MPFVTSRSEINITMDLNTSTTNGSSETSYSEEDDQYSNSHYGHHGHQQQALPYHPHQMHPVQHHPPAPASHRSHHTHRSHGPAQTEYSTEYSNDDSYGEGDDSWEEVNGDEIGPSDSASRPRTNRSQLGVHRPLTHRAPSSTHQRTLPIHPSPPTVSSAGRRHRVPAQVPTAPQSEDSDSDSDSDDLAYSSHHSSHVHGGRPPLTAPLSNPGWSHHAHHPPPLHDPYNPYARERAYTDTRPPQSQFALVPSAHPPYPSHPPHHFDPHHPHPYHDPRYPTSPPDPRTQQMAPYAHPPYHDPRFPHHTRHHSHPDPRQLAHYSPHYASPYGYPPYGAYSNGYFSGGHPNQMMVMGPQGYPIPFPVGHGPPSTSTASDLDPPSKPAEKTEDEKREQERLERLREEKRLREEMLEQERKWHEEKLERERKAEEERMERERKAEEERMERERKAEEERTERRLAEEAAAAAAASAAADAAAAKAREDADAAAQVEMIERARLEAAAAARAEAEARARADAEAAAAEEQAKRSKAVIKFRDAVGRKFSFPFELCRKWSGMEELIKQAFLHVDVIGPHVIQGHYDLHGPDGEIILPQVWESVVEPDWFITMHMWPIPERAPTPAAREPTPAPEPEKKEPEIVEAPPPPPPFEVVVVPDPVEAPPPPPPAPEIPPAEPRAPLVEVVTIERTYSRSPSRTRARGSREGERVRERSRGVVERRGRQEVVAHVEERRRKQGPVVPPLLMWAAGRSVKYSKSKRR